MESYALWKVVGISLVFVVFHVSAQEFMWKHRYKQEQKHNQEYKPEQRDRQVQKSGAVPFLPFLLAGMVVMLGAL